MPASRLLAGSLCWLLNCCLCVGFPRTTLVLVLMCAYSCTLCACHVSLLQVTRP
jgi:hypothetical protein